MKMYAIFLRPSIKLMNGNRGKLAAQAGHAYLHAYWDAEDRWGWDRHIGVAPYRRSLSAKKVCLVVDTQDELDALYEAYRPVCGVSMVVDAGLTCFDGPTTTCLGLGPIRDEDIKEDLKCLKVLI